MRIRRWVLGCVGAAGVLSGHQSAIAQRAEVFISVDTPRAQAGDVITLTVHAEADREIAGYAIAVVPASNSACLGVPSNIEVLAAGGQNAEISQFGQSVVVAQLAVASPGDPDPDLSGELFRFTLEVLGDGANDFEFVVAPFEVGGAGGGVSYTPFSPLVPVQFPEVEYVGARVAKGAEFIDAILSGLPLVAFGRVDSVETDDGFALTEIDPLIDGGFMLNTGEASGLKVKFGNLRGLDKIAFEIETSAAAEPPSGNSLPFTFVGEGTISLEIPASPLPTRPTIVQAFLEGNLVAEATSVDGLVIGLPLGLNDAADVAQVGSFADRDLEFVARLDEDDTAAANLLQLISQISFTKSSQSDQPLDIQAGRPSPVQFEFDGLVVEADGLKIIKPLDALPGLPLRVRGGRVVVSASRDLPEVVDQIDANVAQKAGLAQGDLILTGLGNPLLTGVPPQGGDEGGVRLDSIGPNGSRGVQIVARGQDGNAEIASFVLATEATRSQDAAGNFEIGPAPGLSMSWDPFERPLEDVDEHAWEMDVQPRSQPGRPAGVRIAGIEGASYMVELLDGMGEVAATYTPDPLSNDVFLSIAEEPATADELEWEICYFRDEHGRLNSVVKPVITWDLPNPFGGTGGGIVDSDTFRIVPLSGDVPIEMKSLFLRPRRGASVTVRPMDGEWDRCNPLDFDVPYGQLEPRELRTAVFYVARGVLLGDFTMDLTVDFNDVIRAARIFDRGCAGDATDAVGERRE